MNTRILLIRAGCTECDVTAQVIYTNIWPPCWLHINDHFLTSKNLNFVIFLAVLHTFLTVPVAKCINNSLSGLHCLGCRGIDFHPGPDTLPLIVRTSEVVCVFIASVTNLFVKASWETRLKVWEWPLNRNNKKIICQ